MADLLLAHESPFIRTLLAALLEADHAVVARVSNGVEAVEVYPDVDPDVAILARSMPIRDGIEACRELRDLDPDARVIICASDGGVVGGDAREAGADGIVVSPFQRSGVLAAVDRALE